VASVPSRRDPGLRPTERARGSGARRWSLLLLVPLLGVLIPPIYDMKDPTLIGIPFFYWYQMAWIPISVACTVAYYRATRERR
jgi:hypothetical protein